MKNILITGIPRSGTSLVSSLVAKNSDSVVFSEPDWLKEIRLESHNCKVFATNLSSMISILRSNVINGIPLKLKYNKETLSIPSNYYLRNKSDNLIIDKKEIEVVFDKHYAHNPFYIKSNAQFTSCLNELIQTNKFKIFCIIRNPISCIMSWRSLNIPVSHGSMKVAEKYSNSFRDKTKNLQGLLRKQAAIIDWHYQIYTKYAEYIKIIKYEELVSNTKTIIERITDSTALDIPELKSKNKSSNYNLEEVSLIVNQLKKTGEFYKEFYPNLQY